MAKFTDFIIGGMEILAGALVAVASGGILTPMAAMLIASGAGMIISGIGTLMAGNNQPGLAWASRNPIKAWDICYGACAVGGTVIHIEEETCHC